MNLKEGTNYSITGGATGLRIAYNPDFNIVFMAVLKNSQKDYYNLSNVKFNSISKRYIKSFDDIDELNNTKMNEHEKIFTLETLIKDLLYSLIEIYFINNISYLF